MTTANGTNEVHRRGKAEIEAASDKPARFEINADGIPAEMKAEQLWCCWCWKRVKRKPGMKWTKPPTNLSGSNLDVASLDDDGKCKRTSYYRFDHVMNALAAGKLDGIGFVFVGGPYLGIDLDDCRDPDTGEIEQWARDIINTVNTYTEVSPSGTGVKLLCRAALPAGGNRRGLIEFYAKGRYFTVTGARLEGTPATVEDRQAEVEKVHAEIFKADKADQQQGTPPSGSTPLTLDDVALLAKAQAAKNGAKFRRLWDGDSSEYDGDTSRGDQALACMLCYWTDRDAGRIDRLFKQSARYRDKWDERRGQQTYGERTIAEALSTVSEGYRPRQAARKPARDEQPSPAPDAPDAAEFEPDEGKTTVSILRDYFRQKYEPTFRKGNRLYSGREGREIARADACAAPTSDLIPLMLEATDYPRGRDGGTSTAEAPRWFKLWGPVAFADLQAALPDEANAGEVSASAREQFQAAVTTVLLSLEQFRTPAGDREDVQRRSLLSWCSHWAKPGPWRGIRSLALWTRRDDGGQLCVAMHVRLWEQVRRGAAPWSQNQFGRLAEAYDVGTAGKAAGSRAVELDHEFLAELLAEPEMDDSVDDSVDDNISARATSGRPVNRPPNRPKWTGEGRVVGLSDLSIEQAGFIFNL